MNEEEKRELFWKQRVEGNVQASRVPKSSRGLKFKNLTETEGNRKAIRTATDFLVERIDPPLLLFIGVPGVGKTTLAYLIAWGFLEAGETVIYYQAEELLNDLQSKLEDGKEYGRFWSRLKAADLVVLDDLGAHNRTAWRDAQLDALVDYRYRERLPLVMTANKLADQSERILDRVKEGASAVITGESWRGKGKTK